MVAHVITRRPMATGTTSSNGLSDLAGAAALVDAFHARAAAESVKQDFAVWVGNDAATFFPTATEGSDRVQQVSDMPITGTNRSDVLNGTAEADVILGLNGEDVINGRGGDDTIDGGSGKDQMTGGLGDDRYVVDNGLDVVIERAHGGRDTVESSDTYRLPDEVEVLVLTGDGSIGGFGSDKANVITGNSGYNGLFGGGGNDVIDGGAGDDRLEGGAGTDRLTGGAGNDRFVFAAGDTAATVGKADRILDFSQADHDHIDLRPIDAGNAKGAFAFIGDNAFSGTAGELRFEITRGGDTLVLGDTDGDGSADVVIRLAGAITLTADDFML